MKFLKSCLLLIVFLQIAGVPGVQSSTYGSGDFGEGFYSPTSTPIPSSSPSSTPTPTPTSIPTSTPTQSPTSNAGSGSSSSSSGTNSGSNSCGNIPPGSNPFLYQVDRLGQKATLYFNPASNPYDRYVISYGLEENAEGYNARYMISNSSGAIDFTVDLLDPSTTYYFKVMALNDCKPSGWSNVIQAKGINPRLITKTSYYPSWTQTIAYTTTQVVNTVKNTINSLVNRNTSPVNPQPIAETNRQEADTSAPVNNTQSNRMETQSQPQPKSAGNWFTNIINGFLNFFR